MSPRDWAPHKKRKTIKKKKKDKKDNKKENNKTSINPALASGARPKTWPAWKRLARPGFPGFWPGLPGKCGLGLASMATAKLSWQPWPPKLGLPGFVTSKAELSRQPWSKKPGLINQHILWTSVLLCGHFLLMCLLVLLQYDSQTTWSLNT